MRGLLAMSLLMACASAAPAPEPRLDTGPDSGGGGGGDRPQAPRLDEVARMRGKKSSARSNSTSPGTRKKKAWKKARRSGR